MRTSFLLVILCLRATLNWAQTPEELVLPVRVNVLGDSLRFSWPAQTGHSDFLVVRKARTSATWVPQDTLLAADTSWAIAVAPGLAYEYQITRRGGALSATFLGYAGVDYTAPVNRGGLVVVADSTYALPLATQFDTLRADLAADGWRVHWLWATRTQPTSTIRDEIIDLKAHHPDIRGVYLVGHVPVPYSGNIAPDGHSPDHQGAWPADVYYGELDAAWPDLTVNAPTATRPENQNVPGDGKWDPNTLQAAGSKADLFVGRADFYNLPDFSVSDTALLAAYLHKCHSFRLAQWSLPLRCIVDDNFGYFSGESFATSGWRMGISIAGPQATSTGEWDELTAQPALLAYGTGPGTYTSVGGVTTTANFVTDTFRTAFTMLFGSYHGDWDTPNNVMRAALASGPNTLTCGWAGRPHWFVHPMALGEPIGYSLLSTQNNYSPTQYAPSGNFVGGVHVGLLGDPTLRIAYPPPPINFSADTLPGGNYVALAWAPSSGSNPTGWMLLHAPHPDSTWQTLATLEASQLSFTDTLPVVGANYYRICALRRDTTNGGTYLNPSLSISDSAFVLGPTLGQPTAFGSQGFVTLFPNPMQTGQTAQLSRVASGDIINFQGQVLNSFSETQRVPTQGLSPGIYMIRLTSGQTLRIAITN